MSPPLKRLVSLLLSAATISLGAGCRREASSRKLIAVIIPSEDNPFFKTEGDTAAAQAKALGYRVRVDSHNDDAYQQDNLIDVAIASNAAALILDNAGTDASISAVRRAAKAGIAVILIDREISATGLAKAQIIADNVQGATLVAEEFARHLNGSGNYAELLGRESDSNAQVRTKGFHAVLDHYPNLHLVEAQSANWSAEQAFRETETILQAHSNLNGILAGNDTMALGAAAAVRASRRAGITIVGFDGSPEALAAIRAGEIEATVLQPAVFISQLAVNEANRYLRSGTTGHPERQSIPCYLVTRANVDEFHNFEKGE